MTKAKSYQEVKPCNLTKSQIEAFAEAMAEDLGYEPGCDLWNIVAELGGEIGYREEYSSSGSSNSLAEASIWIDDIGEFCIELPSDTSVLRDRFTIAHELGHYFLHFLLLEQQEKVKAARSISNRAEWEANWFAAAFLMPKDEFERTWERLDDEEDVAEHFCVSVSAVRVRAKVLGCK